MNRLLPFTLLAAASLIAMIAVAAAAAPEATPFGSFSQDEEVPWTMSSRLSGGDFTLAQEDGPSADFLSSFEAEAPRRWWPVVLSIAVPGLGETVTGYRRGWFMMAADAGLWAGVKSQNDKGNDKEVEFEAFADAHWSESEWELALFNGDLEPYFGLTSGSTKNDVALYVSREQDEREWYENLGKWDVFAWGWEEYWADGYSPGDPANPQFNTPLRQQYIDLRGESNDAFRNRDRFLTTALLFRVVSMLQVAYLEGFIGGRYKGAGAESEGPTSGWYMQPEGLSGAQVGWKVSY